MATTIKTRNGFVIVITLIIAILMMLMPLPDYARFFRPEWVVMTLIYWAMALPHRVSIGVAWCTGFIMDVTMGGILGVMAFSYALAIYLIARFHLQLRQYPLWQQALTILSVVFLVEFIDVAVARATLRWESWMPVLTSTLLWPLMYAVLRKIRRTFQVT
ncbi:rod shape-determining protein MreD [Methylophaga thalassica]|jgi:rod shape-determining protein MreD|uniref:Rod shape-determining protein MreD n=1 Tax=Methylophaga thalassica TaxID=40223 RepID=A0ABQ5TW18_9GAMM|nr:rod shape-determining protein MreD [Methylophaga thalassica]GLP99757.1 rod shape-determining protein MreD [Methylophaga thalassica]